MSEEEIKSLLSGEVGNVENDDTVALIFAQHYAETRANPNKEALQRLFETYGEEKANDILGVVRGIMVGNIHGIAIDLLQSRLRGKSDPDSSFWTEISTAVGIVLFIPYLGVKKLFGFLKPKQLYITTVESVKEATSDAYDATKEAAEDAVDATKDALKD